jgi:alpha-D-xyloside xylohydrolase
MKTSGFCFTTILSVSWLLAATARAAPIPVVAVHKDADGLTLKMKPGTLKLEVFSPRIIRVVYGPGETLPPASSLAVIAKPGSVDWKASETDQEVRLRTDELEARVDRATGAVGFYDKSGKPLLMEKADGGKSLIPDQTGGLNTLRSRQEFVLAPEEAIYGLGQHQNGLMNYRGATIHLQQRNPGESAVPVLVSSQGYGVLWDNPAITDVSVGAGNGQKVEQPAAHTAALSWTSAAADAIDYYFMYGPALDRVIADYRDLTGAAPMFGKWAWGFWQCKEHYASQQELLDVVDRYHSLHIPLDGIIQDWQYWTPNPWGSHRFDTNRYPDVTQLMRELHGTNTHMIISVWARFDVGCSNWLELKNAGCLYTQVLANVYPRGQGQWYDAFNPIGRRIYWQQISKALFSKGIDGWWLDASEPELSGHWGEFRNYATAAGPGIKVFNAYPLLQTTGIYKGQRAESSKERVFILTRSAYTGQQRNAAVTWSGDIHGTWDVFARQIPAGLNFSLSGIPYWNTDTGGFFGGDPANPRYAELFTRWFQFSAFCPMFRVHGSGKPKEMWRFDTNTGNILIHYDQLRYHLLPYTYSVSWRVTSEGYSMMRGLVMDFCQDTNVYDIPDQYLFGPALMVNPVTRAGATARSVYLPTGTSWTDFWTGKSYPGGQTIEAAAPIETLPLFVRAGSIIPYDPAIEYAMEGDGPIELRVYRGADGAFTLYEDEGDNYNYEKGDYATIPILWNEATQTLTIGQRQGSFRGMLKKRTFRVVWVAPGHGAGIPSTELPDATVHYTGSALKVSAENRGEKRAFP